MPTLATTFLLRDERSDRGMLAVGIIAFCIGLGVRYKTGSSKPSIGYVPMLEVVSASPCRTRKPPFEKVEWSVPRDRRADGGAGTDRQRPIIACRAVPYGTARPIAKPSLFRSYDRASNETSIEQAMNEPDTVACG